MADQDFLNKSVYDRIKDFKKNPAFLPTWAKPTTRDIVEEVRWWEAKNIPWQLVKELRRRNNSNNIGQQGSIDASINFKNDYEKYKGPLTPWIRVFSNGTGQVIHPNVPISKYLLKNNKLPVYKGFLLEGGTGFNNAYGFKKNGNTLVEDKAIIGYQSDGTPHYIDLAYRSQYSYNTNNLSTDEYKVYPQNNVVSSIVPPPGVVSVSINTNKDSMATATINWKCYGLAQLEYMTPFFLIPKINLFLEFGWNLFNQESLVNLNDDAECYNLILRPYLALERYYKSFGNYGLITGIITGFKFNSDDGFCYNCETVITSRQAMWTGFPADSPTTVATSANSNNNQQKNNTTEYLSIKQFFSLYLQFTKQIVKKKENFIDYINNNPQDISQAIQKQKLDDKSKSLLSNLNKAISSLAGVPNNTQQKTTAFYGGKPESRIFIGRYDGIYNGYKLPRKGTSTHVQNGVSKQKPDYIEYGVQKNNQGFESSTLSKNKNIISFADKETDFDYNENAEDEVWYQLDFVFELINLFCADPVTRINYIDISDVIVSGHPNLISCDKNVLIPNSIAPKINIGRASTKDNPDGYLYQDVDKDVVDPNKNFFLKQAYYVDLKNQVEDGKRIETERANKVANTGIIDVSKKTEKPVWKAALKANQVFKTKDYPRDNLDILINKLYYDIGQNTPGSAAFPFTTDVRKYDAFYYGYLKHIYISKSKLIEIGNDEKIRTLEQVINKILNIVNDSVEGFWRFEVRNNGSGGLTITDKNIGLFRSEKIYMFDIGSTSNVVKKFNFDVNCTNSQTAQILYETGHNAEADLNKQVTNIINSSDLTANEKKSKLTEIGNSMPAINFRDRFDNYVIKEKIDREIGILDEELKKLNTQNSSNSTINKVPHGPIADRNPTIQSLQKYGGQTKDVLVMCTRALSPGEDPTVDDANVLIRNWVYLNLPSSLKPKLRQMIDDSDIKFNNAKYAGPADNFIINITLDGIFGFEMHQHFAVANLPKPFVPGNVIFMVTEVKHELSGGRWETTMQAMLRGANDKDFEFIPI